MKKALLFLLTLAGLSALSTNIFREYHYVKMLKTWAEAQSYCRVMFNDLATVGSKAEHDRLLSVLQGNGEYAWIGLQDDLTRWKWTLGNADFNLHTNFSDWKSYEPNNRRHKQACTMVTIYKDWADLHCEVPRPALCYNEQGPSTYIFVATKMTWYQAKNYCRSKYTDLASVRNQSENKHIVSLLPDRAWIGLYRMLWPYWSDSSRTTFTNWNVGEPDNSGAPMQSCSMVNTTTGKWYDADCETKHYFICQQTPVQHQTTIKLKFQSEADLNDPAVEQQILEQLHSKLEKHGLPDFKLRWIETDGQTFHKEQKKKKEEGSA